jgi:hypothetical protein
VRLVCATCGSYGHGCGCQWKKGQSYARVKNTSLGPNGIFSNFCLSRGITIPDVPYGVSVKDNGDVYYSALVKFAHSIDVPATTLWRKAVDRTRQVVINHTGRTFFRQMTIDEACARVAAKAGSSTPGYLYNKFGRTKREALQHPDFRKLVEWYVEHPSSCLRLYYTASLKDERRAIRDGAVRDARLFMPVDLILLVLDVMVYGDFCDAFVDSGVTSRGLFIYRGADDLVKKLGGPEETAYSDDASHFDASHNSLSQRAWVRVVKDLVPDSPLKRVLDEIQLKPRVVMPDGRVYELPGGNPSGGFKTFVKNTVVSMVNIEHAFLREGIPRQRYDATGDDTLTSGLDPHLKLHSQVLGFDYKSEPTTTVENAEFCQHGFTWYEGHGYRGYVAVPKPERMWAALKYCRVFSPVGLFGVAASLYIDHFFHPVSAPVLLQFMQFLHARYHVPWTALDDVDIVRLHLSKVVPETAGLAGTE